MCVGVCCYARRWFARQRPLPLPHLQAFLCHRLPFALPPASTRAARGSLPLCTRWLARQTRITSMPPDREACGVFALHNNTTLTLSLALWASERLRHRNGEGGGQRRGAGDRICRRAAPDRQHATTGKTQTQAVRSGAGQFVVHRECGQSGLPGAF